MPSVIIDSIYNAYLTAYDNIRDEVDSHFAKGFLFVLLWMFIFGMITGLVFVTRYYWIITAILVTFLLLIETFCWIGRKLERERT